MSTFQNKKINRYTPDSVDPKNVVVDFDMIDGFFDNIKEYIHTEIHMTDYTETIEMAFKSRLQILTSNVLYRSLMLKDGIVQSLNDANFPMFYAGLKSFMEIVGVLGYLSNMIYQEDDYKTLIEKINKLSLGNKDAGIFPRGDIDAINVMTMLEKADKKFCESLSSEEIKEEAGGSSILYDSYSDICNFGHPNFNAHLSTGKLNTKTQIWNVRVDATGYKINLYDYYMHAFTISISAILFFSSQIDKCPKVNSFNGVKSKKLF